MEKHELTKKLWDKPESFNHQDQIIRTYLESAALKLDDAEDNGLLNFKKINEILGLTQDREIELMPEETAGLPAGFIYKKINILIKAVNALNQKEAR